MSNFFPRAWQALEIFIHDPELEELQREAVEDPTGESFLVEATSDLLPESEDELEGFSQSLFGFVSSLIYIASRGYQKIRGDIGPGVAENELLGFMHKLLIQEPAFRQGFTKRDGRDFIKLLENDYIPISNPDLDDIVGAYATVKWLETKLENFNIMLELQFLEAHLDR